MSHPAIRVEHLSKRYQVGELTSKYDYITFREALVRAATAPIQRLRMLRGQVPATQSIWALKDVSFEVQPGEVVGIIGRNGAGKSTLLKILSQITEPTQGRVEMRGRVASLLEVGTGFHPELTGRENIYLNGAILGMTRREIESKFDQIVDFSGVERFIDTPVKRYSTGMYLRLAFAVAAHLDPEILIVDEVLAVGDAAFQKKCLGRMGEVARSGRTVLFVSHNMPAVRALCSTGVVLDSGVAILRGSADAAVDTYLKQASAVASTPLRNREDRQGSGKVRFTDIWVESPPDTRADAVASGDTVRIVATFEKCDSWAGGVLDVAFRLHAPSGELITVLWSQAAGCLVEEAPAAGTASCEIPRLPLRAGEYPISVFCNLDGVPADLVTDAGTLNVEDGDFFGTGLIPETPGVRILMDQRWTISSDGAH